LKSEVIGWEDVLVPAGKFRAIRIDSRGFWRSGCGTDKLAYKFWYSPQVKSFVRSESIVYHRGEMIVNAVRELTAYKVD